MDSKGSGRAPLVPGCGSDVKFAPEAGRVGLRNLGNTCFMNAGLQCLCHIEPLVAYFLSNEFEKEINTTSPFSSKGDISRAFAELTKALWRSKSLRSTAFNPLDIRKKLAQFAPHLFEGGEQQDVQEFLAFCIDGLHEDLNRVAAPPKPSTDEDEEETDEERQLREEHGEEYAAASAWLQHLQHGKSFLVDLLQGQLRSSLTCSQCGFTSRRFDPFLYLSLPVAKNMRDVTDCLKKFLDVETLTGSDQWHCEKCKANVDATKKFDIWKLPPVLVLHLKRFEFDAKKMLFEKTENCLRMKISGLDLSGYCESTQRDGAMYNVVCVANHSGKYGSGHYTATCRVGGDAPWHRFDDSKVTPIDGRQVVTKDTYVMFLVRDQHAGIAAKAAKKNVPRPLLLRRQTPSEPENWPHPEALVSALVNLKGRTAKTDGDCSPSSSSSSTSTTASGSASDHSGDLTSSDGAENSDAVAGNCESADPVGEPPSSDPLVSTQVGSCELADAVGDPPESLRSAEKPSSVDTAKRARIRSVGADQPPEPDPEQHLELPTEQGSEQASDMMPQVQVHNQMARLAEGQEHQHDEPMHICDAETGVKRQRSLEDFFSKAKKEEPQEPKAKRSASIRDYFAPKEPDH